MLPVLMLTPKWSETIMVDPRPEPLCCVRPDPAGGHSAVLRVTRRDGRTETLGFPVRVGTPVGEGAAMKSWGLSRLGPGVWAVSPSIHQPGLLHAYVVLCDVPEPAPFA
jgi:hypothetical protein